MPQLADGDCHPAPRPGRAVHPPAPAEADSQGWGTLAADLMAAAWTASPTLQSAGRPGADHQLLRRDVQPSRPLFALRGARGRRRGSRPPLRRGRGGHHRSPRPAPPSSCRPSMPTGPAAEAGIRPGDRSSPSTTSRPAARTSTPCSAGSPAIEGTDLTLTVRDRRGRLRDGRSRARDPAAGDRVHQPHGRRGLLVRISAFASDTDQRLAHDLDDQFGKRGRRRARWCSTCAAIAAACCARR